MLLEKILLSLFYSQETGGGQGSPDDLLDDLTGGEGDQTPPATVEGEQTTPNEDDPTKVTPPATVEGEQTPPGDGEEDKGQTNPMRQMRESLEAEKKRVKELEEAQKKQASVSESLLRATQLGIKGETVEEILENLKEYDIKQEASKLGLTEDQIKKDQELQERMDKLNKQEQETLFNRRAFDLQVKKGMTEEQVIEFVNEAGNLGINLLTTTVNFEKIYDRLYNTETQTSIKEKDTRIAELEKEIKTLKAGRAPEAGVTGLEGKADKLTGDAALDALAKELI